MKKNQSSENVTNSRQLLAVTAAQRTFFAQIHDRALTELFQVPFFSAGARVRITTTPATARPPSRRNGTQNPAELVFPTRASRPASRDPLRGNPLRFVFESEADLLQSTVALVDVVVDDHVIEQTTVRLLHFLAAPDKAVQLLVLKRRGENKRGRRSREDFSNAGGRIK